MAIPEETVSEHISHRTQSVIETYGDNENQERLENLQETRNVELSNLQLGLLIMSLCLNNFLVALDFNILATALPRITDEFRDLNSVAWYGVAYFITTSALHGVWGKLFKSNNIRWLVLVALFIFETGSLICALAPNSPVLIIGRSIQGVGGSGIRNGTYIIVGVCLPFSWRPMFTGIMGVVWGVAFIIGPLLGGVLTQTLTWRWCFYINLPLGGVVGILLLLIVRPINLRTRALAWTEAIWELDPLGVLFLISASICIVLALHWGGVEKPWTNSQVLGCIVGFVLLFSAFITDQYVMKERASYPLRALTRNVLIGVVWNWLGATGIHTYFLPLYFQTIIGVGPISSGLHLLPMIIGLAVFSVAAGIIIATFGMPIYVMLAGVIMSCAGSGLVYTFNVDTSSSKWIVSLALLGLGYGFTTGLGILVGQLSCQREDMAVATAALNFTQTYGAAIFVAVAQNVFLNIFTVQLSQQLPDVTSESIITAGATTFRDNLSPEQLAPVLRIFMNSLRHAYILPVVLTGVTFFLPFLLDANMKRKGKIRRPGEL